MCCWGEKGLNSLVVARFSGRGEEGVVAFPHPQELLLLLGEHLGLVLPGMDAQRMVSTAEPDRVRWPARDSLGVVGKVADAGKRCCGQDVTARVCS
jgi:hypothetical protein